MDEKNAKLAKENSSLKSAITMKTQLQEDILKKAIKLEYTQIVSYKQMIEVIDSNIESLEIAINNCKAIKETILKNRQVLADKSNFSQYNQCSKVNKIIEEYKKNSSDILENEINVKNENRGFFRRINDEDEELEQRSRLEEKSVNNSINNWQLCYGKNEIRNSNKTLINEAVNCKSNKENITELDIVAMNQKVKKKSTSSSLRQKLFNKKNKKN